MLYHSDRGTYSKCHYNIFPLLYVFLRVCARMCVLLNICLNVSQTKHITFQKFSLLLLSLKYDLYYTVYLYSLLNLPMQENYIQKLFSKLLHSHYFMVSFCLILSGFAWFRFWSILPEVIPQVQNRSKQGVLICFVKKLSNNNNFYFHILYFDSDSHFIVIFRQQIR